MGKEVDARQYMLQLNESMEIGRGNVEIKRVPGGWIYTFFRLDAGQMNTVFVPFNNEFQHLNTEE